MFDGPIVFVVALAVFVALIAGGVAIDQGRKRKEGLMEGCGWALILSLFTWAMLIVLIRLIYAFFDLILGGNTWSF